MILVEAIGNETRINQEGQHEGITEHINRYEAFLMDMKSNWWLEKARGIIRETDIDYIRTFPLRRRSAGKVMEMRCPQSKAVSIFGKNQTECKAENKTKEFNIKDPYAFTMRCFDNHDEELDQAARINIKKVSTDGGISSAWRLCYGNLAPKKPGYQFPEGAYLFSNEILVIEIINPDIDIERTEILIEADVFQVLNEH